MLYKIHGDFSHPDLLSLHSGRLPAVEHWPGSEVYHDPVASPFRSKRHFIPWILVVQSSNILSLLLGREFASRGAPRHKRFAALYSGDDFENGHSDCNDLGRKGFYARTRNSYYDGCSNVPSPCT